MRIIKAAILALSLLSTPAMAVDASCQKPFAQLTDVLKNESSFTLVQLTPAQVAHLVEALPPPSAFDTIYVISDGVRAQILVVLDGCIEAQTGVVSVQEINNLTGTGNASTN